MSDRWKAMAGQLRIGVISDTHGRLDAAVRRYFAGVDHIIHAGDVGVQQVLDELATLAPVTAVAGNMDAGELRQRLPEEASGQVRGVRFLVGHKQRRLLQQHTDPAREGYDLVVIGHTHVAFADWHNGVLYLNPGTAAAPEPGDRPTVAVVEVDVDGLDPHIIDLD